jgi:glycosyltransferase involved in cell wall biosynthesis
MAAADFLVQGSHREGSGYSVLEALACGLPPLVTDIPSFRVLTGDGAAGRLWSPGQPASLAQALLQLHAEPAAQRRVAARACFEVRSSFDALGRKLFAAYSDLIRP